MARRDGTPSSSGAAKRVPSIAVTPRISLDERELEESFVRASGAGGQNIHKVSSAVQLRFDAAASPGLGEAVRERLLRLAGHRATRAGVITIHAQRFRTQERNRDDARERLFALIRDAAVPPPPARRATRPTRGSVQRRLEGKSVRSEIKRGRGRPGED